MLTLAVEKRIKAGQGLGSIRREGKIPAVVYGAHTESLPITLSAKEFDKIFSQAGEATIVALTGVGEDIPTLIHDVQLDPLTSAPSHVDFYAVTKGQKVEVKIPIEFIGESVAVREGANLVKVLYEIEIKADPMNLPHSFVVDISNLAKIGDQIHVRDLAAPAGVEVMTDSSEVIALAQEVVEEKVEEAPVDLNAAIEVEKKGKEEAEEAAAETK